MTGSRKDSTEFPVEFDGQDCMDDSDDEKELPEFLQDHGEDSKSKNYGMANIKDPQIQKNIQRKLHIINLKQQQKQSLHISNNPKFEKNNIPITELTEDSLESERIVNINGVSKLHG